VFFGFTNLGKSGGMEAGCPVNYELIIGERFIL